MENKFDIRLVDFDYEKELNEFHFYPDRKFDSETVVFLYRKESFGNGQYLNYFYECDKRNIKVNVFCTHNFFPLASLVGHSCYTAKITDRKKHSFINPNAKLSRYYTFRGNSMIDITKHFNIKHLFPVEESADPAFCFDYPLQHSICQHDPPCESAKLHEKYILNKHKIQDLQRVEDLFSFYKNRPIYLSKQFFDHFQTIKNEFEEDRICVELKPKASPYAVELLQSLGSDRLVNVSKNFMWKAANDYNLFQTYLSFQFLMCLHKNWRYIALGGASNVMQSFYPMNVMLFGDSHSTAQCANTPPLKIKLNKYFYNEEPIKLTLGGHRCDELEFHRREGGQWNDVLDDFQISIVKNKILSHL